MKWSQHRKQLKDFVVPELRKRIDFHVTSYRHSHDQMGGEAFISLDGEKVFEAGYYKWWKAFSQERKRIREEPVETTSLHDPYSRYTLSIGTGLPETEAAVLARGAYETGFVLDSFKRYLSTPIEEALVSSNPLLKALAIVDRRLGKRGLRKVVIKEDDPPVVRLFYELRQQLMWDDPATSDEA